MNVLVLCPYPAGVAPSQRFRFELFLDDPDIQYTISPFWSMTAWRRLYRAGNAGRKAIAFCAGFVKRVVLAFNIWRYDKVLVHREAVPFGPPWLEFLIAKVWRKPLIFDFDDAIWMPDPFQKLPGWAELFRCRQKTGWICRWSSVVICGNDWLGAYASRFTARVVTIPTAVDITHSHNRLKNHSDKPVTVGWTGSHSTLPFLMKVTG